MKNRINVNGLTKVFGSKIALDNLRLDLKEGEFLAILGNNGAGKSTLIKILSNVLEYDSGSIDYFDDSLQKVTVQEFKNKLGIVLDKSYLIDELTPVEYLSFISKFHDLADIEFDTRIKDLINILSIESYEKPIEKLSSGNKMKVALAASLIHNPRVLFLDEPFVNLDINSVDNYIRLINSFKGKKSVIISSHSLDLVFDVCERFLILSNGKIVNEFLRKDFNTLNELKEVVKNTIVMEANSDDVNWLNE